MDIKEVINKFDSVYKTVLIPKISPLEKYRQDELKKTKNFFNILFGKNKAIKEEYKLKIESELASIVGSVFVKLKPSNDVIDVDEIRDLGFCSNANSVSYGAILAGNHKNNKITLTEARIQRLSGDKDEKATYSLFSGLVLKIETKLNLNSKTILSRKAKDFSTKERKNVYLGSKVNFRYNNSDKLDVVKFEESEYGKMFEIFSNNETKARKFLTDKLLEKIKSTRDAFLSTGISVAFVNTDIYIFIEKDKFFFEDFDLNKEISNKDEIKKVFVQFLYLLNLINSFS